MSKQETISLNVDGTSLSILAHSFKGSDNKVHSGAMLQYKKFNAKPKCVFVTREHFSDQIAGILFLQQNGEHISKLFDKVEALAAKGVEVSFGEVKAPKAAKPAKKAAAKKAAAPSLFGDSTSKTVSKPAPKAAKAPEAESSEATYSEAEVEELVSAQDAEIDSLKKQMAEMQAMLAAK